LYWKYKNSLFNFLRYINNEQNESAVIHIQIIRDKKQQNGEDSIGLFENKKNQR